MSKTAIQQMIGWVKENVIEERDSLDPTYNTISSDSSIEKLTELKKVEKQNMVNFLDNLRGYIHESGNDLSQDERESIEFVEIYYKENFND